MSKFRWLATELYEELFSTDLPDTKADMIDDMTEVLDDHLTGSDDVTKVLRECRAEIRTLNEDPFYEGDFDYLIAAIENHLEGYDDAAES